MVFQQVAGEFFFFCCCCCKLWFGKKSVINLITFSLILTSQHNLPACLPSNSNIYSWPNWLWGRRNEQYFIVLVAAHVWRQLWGCGVTWQPQGFACPGLPSSSSWTEQDAGRQREVSPGLERRGVCYKCLFSILSWQVGFPNYVGTVRDSEWSCSWQVWMKSYK